jgi:hypothetical protein
MHHVAQRLEVVSHLLERYDIEPRDNLGDAQQGVEVSFRHIVLGGGPLLGQVAEGAYIPGCYQQVAVERCMAAEVASRLPGVEAQPPAAGDGAVGDRRLWRRVKSTARRLVRPTLRWILVLLIALLGWQTLYITNGITFGVGGMLDYLALFLWGLSADVASRTFTNLAALPR